MEQAGLSLHPTKTRIVKASEPGGFDFLGYHFERGYRWPRKKSLDKLKDALRAKTKRMRPDSVEDIIDVVTADLGRPMTNQYRTSIGGTSSHRHGPFSGRTGVMTDLGNLGKTSVGTRSAVGAVHL